MNQGRRGCLARNLDGFDSHRLHCLQRAHGPNGTTPARHAGDPGSTPGGSTDRRPDGETDDHLSPRTRSCGFDSCSGCSTVPSFSGQDVPLTWGRSVVRVHPGLLTTEGLPDRRREPVANRVSASLAGSTPAPSADGTAVFMVSVL